MDDPSHKDVKRLLNEAKRKKVAGLVLDLSSNGGGSLAEAVKVAGLFFKTGNVVKTRGKTEDSPASEVLVDTDPQISYSGPLVVLTSRFSASASEIVAGALKDYQRAVIAGADSYLWQRKCSICGAVTKGYWSLQGDDGHVFLFQVAIPRNMMAYLPILFFQVFMPVMILGKRI